MMCYYLNVQFQGQRVKHHGRPKYGVNEELWHAFLASALYVSQMKTYGG